MSCEVTIFLFFLRCWVFLIVNLIFIFCCSEAKLWFDRTNGHGLLVYHFSNNLFSKFSGFIFLLINVYLCSISFLSLGHSECYDKQLWTVFLSCGANLISCCSSFLVLLLQGLWLYNLYYQIEKNSANVKYDTLSSPVSGDFPSDWTWVSWAVAGFPFIGVLLGAIHSCFSACKESSQVRHNTFCTKNYVY